MKYMGLLSQLRSNLSAATGKLKAVLCGSKQTWQTNELQY